MNVKKDILWRAYLSYLFIAVLCVSIIIRAIYIQNVEGGYWRSLSDSLHIKYQTLTAERGTIYSEDGNMLSASIPIYDVYVDFAAPALHEKSGKRFHDNIDSLSLGLSNIFNDKTAQAYKAELVAAYESNNKYYPLKKKISFDTYKQLRSLPLVRQGKNKSGFIIVAKDKRVNPYVILANRTIGISRANKAQNVGLEQYYDSVLSGKEGHQLMRYSAGAYIPVEGAQVEPENGYDIVTTIDTYIQDVTEEALMKMMVNNNSLHGTAIVMETETGKIKAIANLGKQPDGTYAEDLNYGIGKRTEPGSIFKAATLLSLLDDGYVDTATMVDCEGGVKYFSGLRIKDSHLGTGTVTVKDAFAMSSNVAFAKLAYQYYQSQPSKYLAHLHQWGLDTLTGVDLVASSGYPVVKKATSKSWGATTIPFMAHGYEVLVTPLHMLTFYNAIANNGKMMRPYLVSEIKSLGITQRRIMPQVVNNKIASSAAIAQIQACMREVVVSKHGTAKALQDSAYAIAGKTGTAVTALDNRGYNKGNKIYQASFIGFFPAEAPKYTVAVVIQNSRESKLIYGASVSGTVFKDISDKIYRYGVSKSSPKSTLTVNQTGYNTNLKKADVAKIYNYLSVPVIDSGSNSNWLRILVTPKSATAFVNNYAANKKVTPNVVGLGLKDALQILEASGYQVSFSGYGKVLSQSIAAGIPIPQKKSSITIYLN